MTETYELEDTELTADAPEEPEPFVPDTPEKVDWVLGKIADARARAARIRENAEKMARSEEREAERLVWQFGPTLQAFARAQTEGTRKKSLTLHHGTLGFRTKPAGVDYDPDTARAWAFTAAPDALRVDRAALAKRFTVTEAGTVVDGDTGELLAFAKATPAEETFFIK